MMTATTFLQEAAQHRRMATRLRGTAEILTLADHRRELLQRADMLEREAAHLEKAARGGALSFR